MQNGGRGFRGDILIESELGEGSIFYCIVSKGDRK
jgi:hypothetical protein